MPFYSYECPKCHKRADTFKPVSERYDMLCECGSKMELVILEPPNHPKERL